MNHSRHVRMIFALTGALFCIAIFLLVYKGYYTRVEAINHRGSFAYAVFNAHVQKAIALEKGEFFLLHIGFFLLAIAFEHLCRLSIVESFSILCSFHVALTLAAIAQFLFVFSRPRPKYAYCYLLALCLMLLGPVGLPHIDPRIYDHTINNRAIMLLRNTTYTGAQPYVVLAFTYACLLFSRSTENKCLQGKTMLLAAATLFIGAIIKPNFALSFIPTLLIAALRYSASLGRMLAVIFPTVLALLLQYYIGFHYAPPAGTSEFPQAGRMAWEHNSFRFAPWIVWQDNNAVPILSLLLATLFPLYVTWLKAGRVGIPLLISWINLGIAILPYLFLQETSMHGDRNFEWGFWFGLQLLFMASVTEWIEWGAKQRKITHADFHSGLHRIVAPLLLIAHILFGYARLEQSFALLY